jgi:hypothetical protein
MSLPGKGKRVRVVREPSKPLVTPVPEPVKAPEPEKVPA